MISSVTHTRVAHIKWWQKRRTVQRTFNVRQTVTYEHICVVALLELLTHSDLDLYKLKEKKKPESRVYVSHTRRGRAGKIKANLECKRRSWFFCQCMKYGIYSSALHKNEIAQGEA